MLVDHKQQWKERIFRQSAYLSPETVKSQLINFADYKTSCNRSEMPSKYKKANPSYVDLETLWKTRQRGSYINGGSSTPIPQRPSTKDPTQKPTYAVDDKILSVDQFFDVYKQVLAKRKKEEKVLNKKRLEQRRLKVNTIYSSLSSSIVKQPAVSALAAPRVQISSLSTLETSPPPGILKVIDLIEVGSVEKFSPVATPTNFLSQPSLKVISPVHRETKSTVSETIKVSEKVNSTSKCDSDEAEDLRGITKDQRFTEKEVYKHFMAMTVSPKVSKTPLTAAQKERNYRFIFRDPKVMDHAVENSIQRVYKMIQKKINPNTRLYTEGASGNFEASIVEKKEQETDSQTRIFTLTTKDEDLKKGIVIKKEILENIKLIDGVLNKGTFKSLSNPRPVKSSSDASNTKNRFPLRSAIAQKYNLKDRLREQKSSALLLQEMSRSHEKSRMSSRANKNCVTLH